MAAASARRHNPDMVVFYQRLVGRGKPCKLAATAVSRKLVVLANTLLRQNWLWEPAAPAGA